MEQGKDSGRGCFGPLWGGTRGTEASGNGIRFLLYNSPVRGSDGPHSEFRWWIETGTQIPRSKPSLSVTCH